MGRAAGTSITGCDDGIAPVGSREVLSVRAMVRIGPWIVTEKQYVHPRERCQRCGTSIAEVWCCEVDALPERLAALGGQRAWRVGNECGPQLIEVTAEVWKRSTRNPVARMRLLRRLDKLIAAAAAQGRPLPEFLATRRASLIDGSLEERLVRHTSLVCGTHERALGLKPRRP